MFNITVSPYGGRNGETTFKCPVCSKITSYFYTQTVLCNSCSGILPLVEPLKVNIDARIRFHLDRYVYTRGTGM